MKFLRVTSILGIIFLISGIALTAMAAKKPVVVNYWSRKTGPEGAVAGEMIQKFNDRYSSGYPGKLSGHALGRSLLRQDPQFHPGRQATGNI
ncbi:MAG: hypothetical protein GXO98_00345 [Nitrospirae bacterium]|nr:hypothetical protein [Nitrospirota bacterium]